MHFFEIRFIDVYLFLTLFGMGLVLFSLVAFPKTRRKENWIMAQIIGLYLLHLTLIATNNAGWVPNHISLPTGYTFNLMYPPLFLLYFQRAFETKETSWSFLVLSIIGGIILPFLALGESFYRLLVVFSFLGTFGYLLRLLRTQRAKKNNWLVFFFAYFCLFGVTFCLDMLFVPFTHLRTWQMRYIYFSELIILSVGFLYYSLRSPVSFLHVKLQNTRPVQKAVPDLSQESELKLLVSEIESQHLYRDPNLSRAALTEQTGIGMNRISELINQNFGVNFPEWINTYRIKEAQQLLHHAPESSIKEIYFQVGFNSKSAFYKAFKKQIGLTPTAYRAEASSTNPKAA